MTTPRLTVILADDVLLDLEIGRTFFQRSGFRVLTARGGLDALALAVSELPDVVVLDQFMPGLTGTEVCARLKARPDARRVPVVITTAADSEELRRECARVGVDALVPKSAGREELLRAVARILRVPERKSVRVTVLFTVTSTVGGKETMGKAVDMSESGMALETNRRYDVGSQCELRFIAPGERQEFRMSARVTRVSGKPDGKHLLGLEFGEMPPQIRSRLNAYMDRSFCPAVR